MCFLHWGGFVLQIIIVYQLFFMLTTSPGIDMFNSSFYTYVALFFMTEHYD